jgi:hypothetical protein
MDVSHKVNPISMGEMGRLFGPLDPALPLHVRVQLEVDGQLVCSMMGSSSSSSPVGWDVAIKKTGGFYLTGLPFASCLGRWHVGWRREASDWPDGRPLIVRVMVSAATPSAVAAAVQRCTRALTGTQSAITSPPSFQPQQRQQQKQMVQASGSQPPHVSFTGAAGRVGPLEPRLLQAPATTCLPGPNTAAAAAPVATITPITASSSRLATAGSTVIAAHGGCGGDGACDSLGYLIGGPGSLTYPHLRFLDSYKSVSFVRTSELKQLFGPQARARLPVACSMQASRLLLGFRLVVCMSRSNHMHAQVFSYLAAECGQCLDAVFCSAPVLVQVEVDGVLLPDAHNVTFKETSASNSVYYIVVRDGHARAYRSVYVHMRVRAFAWGRGKGVTCSTECGLHSPNLAQTLPEMTLMDKRPFHVCLCVMLPGLQSCAGNDAAALRLPTRRREHRGAAVEEP